MKAIVRSRPGKALSTMQVMDLPPPSLPADHLRIRVATSRINPVDVDLMKGMPFLKYKQPQIGGIDGAGEVLERGTATTGFQPGDRVFFYRHFTDMGTWAEEISVPANVVAKIPQHLELTDAGAVALPLLTAFESMQQFQGKTGQTILIHGGAGGVGFQAVQVAVALGRKVVATASAKDEKRLKTAGVAQCIDYKSQRFEQVLKPGAIDFIFDTVGKDTLLRSMLLRPKKVVSVHYADPALMHKTGMKVPGVLKLILKLANRKFTKAAKKEGVTLLGQVTGGNGKTLQKAADLAQKSGFIVGPYTTISIQDIAQQGLNGKSVGRIIVF